MMRFARPLSYPENGVSFRQNQAGSRGEARNRRPPWMFGSWAYFSAFYASLFSITFGLAGYYAPLRADARLPLPFLPFIREEIKFVDRWLELGAAVAGGAVIILIAFVQPMKRSGGFLVKPLRIIFFFVISLPMFASYFTMVPAACYLLVSFLFMISAWLDEVGEVHPLRLYGYKIQVYACRGGAADVQVHIWRFCHRWFALRVFKSAVRRLFVLGMWGGACFGLFLANYKFIQRDLDALDLTKLVCYMDSRKIADAPCLDIATQLKKYLPYAKGFGIILNFNAALIFFLITRSIIQRLTDISLRPTWSRVVRWFVNVGRIPLQNHVFCHQFVAMAIFLATCGHVVAHFMAYSHALPMVDRVIPWFSAINAKGNVWVQYSVYATGGMMCVLLVFMYGLSMEPVRQIKYSVFISVHIASAVLFYALLWWHATAYVHWGLLPFSLYIMDLQLRSFIAAHAEHRLLRVVFTDHVLHLVFSAPWEWKSGMYAWLQCPRVYKDEWHPFTISSPYESGELTFHFKVWPEGWTEQVRDFMREFCEEKETKGKARKIGRSYEFSHKNWLTGTNVLGTMRHDGQPIFIIDGPHPAPPMRYNEYETIILAGAGLGLTPMNSIVQQLTRYHWQKKTQGTTINVYLVWICMHQQLGEFTWFVNSLSDTEVAVRAAQLVSTHYRYEAHLFVTGAITDTSTDSDPTELPQQKQRVVDCPPLDRKITRPYTGQYLMGVLKKSNVHSCDFKKTMAMEASRPSYAMQQRGLREDEAEERAQTVAVDEPPQNGVDNDAEFVNINMNDGADHAIAMKAILKQSDMKKKDSNYASTSLAADARSNACGHTHIWSGRPCWTDIFEHVAKKHQAYNIKEGRRRVGVFFCGGALVLNDLQEAAERCRSKLIKFDLHEEHF
eukprot:GEMP01006059.1.p1 GENE.GEMP01006059.1~~GEMP01006059.1.p1  ORF type:complete len:897 (+),score=108.42 GEMP01006059.1:268-2958(+)